MPGVHGHTGFFMWIVLVPHGQLLDLGLTRQAYFMVLGCIHLTGMEKAGRSQY